MKLAEIHIDEATWNGADDTRRREWRIAMDEMIADDSLEFAPDAHGLHIAMAEQGFTLALRDVAGSEVGKVELLRDVLSKHVTEYVDIVRQMERVDSSMGSSRIEALDMAKKVTHDRAGRVLKRQLRPLGVDHEVARRMFSLLAALAHDTSELSGVHAALLERTER